MRRVAIYLIVFLLCLAVLPAFSDVIHLKNGGRQMGIVVEEYADRIVLSLPEGEVEILLSQIKNIIYDDPENNYMMLASKYEERKDYQKAIRYYNLALEIKPDLRKAKDAISRINDSLKKKKARKEELLQKLRAKKEKLQKIKESHESVLKSNVGFLFEKEGDNFKVSEVVPNSPADNAGIKENDYLVSIWDKAVKFSHYDKVIKMLIGSKGSKVDITIQRNIKPEREEIKWGSRTFSGIGASLSMEETGLTIISVMPKKPADLAGLKALDLVIAINGQPTRYMPMEEAIRKISSPVMKTIDLLINRHVQLIRGPELTPEQKETTYLDDDE
ncbi:MAG: PDZ domain-containing protein [Candidatus Auribacterota bacterium]|nr:PDZ domain-containing protein [Candidatus Auribacterota bacterium]